MWRFKAGVGRAAWVSGAALCAAASSARAADPSAAPAAVRTATDPSASDAPVEVLVVGDRVRDRIAPKDPSVAGSVIPRDRLEGPGLEAADVLRTQPGVTVTESGGFGAPATAAVRGATAADTPVYLGGIRLNDDVGGTADLSTVPLWLIDRVEIYRGNAPIEADRLGPGGAIFFEPRRPNENAGGAGMTGGSWGASKGWAYQGVHAPGVRALVGVGADHATNRYPFLDDHGTLFEPGNATVDIRQNADEKTVDGWALAGVDLGRGATIDVLANGITRQQGVPSLALVQTTRARESTERALGGVDVRVPLGGDGRAAFDSHTSVVAGSSTYDDPLLELALFTKHLVVGGWRVAETLGATLEPTDALRIRPVVDVAHEQVERDPDDIPLGRAHREFARVAVAADERVVDGLVVRALASGECHHTGAKNDALCDVLEPTGRLGVDVGSGRLKGYANAGRYVRVPTLGEVYGVDGTVHGNPNLEPESGFTVDAGIRARSPRLGAFDGAFVDAFAFARWAQGLIAYERAGQGYVVPYNVGSARVLGVEVLAGVGFFRFLRAEVAGTWLDPRDTSAGRTTVNDVLPYRSRFIASPRLRAEWARRSRGGVSAAGAGLGALYQSSRYVDPAGLGVIDAQTTVDVDAYVSFFDGLLTVRGRVADLFDARRTDIIGYPLPGRSVYAGAEATW